MFCLNRSDTVPLLYYYLLKSWALVFGSSDRRRSAYSCLTRGCRNTFDWLAAKVGSISAMLLAISSVPHSTLSQEVRPYALLFFNLFGLTLHFIIRIQQRSSSGDAHGISVLYLLALNLCLLINRDNQRNHLGSMVGRHFCSKFPSVSPSFKDYATRPGFVLHLQHPCPSTPVIGAIGRRLPQCKRLPCPSGSI